MKVIDILNKKHTVLSSVDGLYEHQGLYDYNQSIMDMKTILFELGKRYSEQINNLRLMQYHSKEQKEFKERFPCWFVGGTFPLQQTEDNDILEYSNILAIDIDKCDNTDKNLEDIRKEIYDLWYVFAVLKSISGKGYYALVLVEDGKFTKDYYTYLAKLWNKKFGLVIDEQCTNIGRKRFISYEDNIHNWIKSNDTDIIPWKLKYIKPIEKSKVNRMIDYRPTSYDSNNLVRKAIWKLLNGGYSIDNMNVTTSHYGVWYHTACEFHHFDDGFDMFVRFSQNSSKYNDKLSDIQKKYNNGKIECPIEDVSKKWCGICKRIYGINWWKD